MENELQKLEEKYNCKFHFFAKHWCLVDEDGSETDDYPAETREQAVRDAVDYLTAYHED